MTEFIESAIISMDRILDELSNNGVLQYKGGTHGSMSKELVAIFQTALGTTFPYLEGEEAKVVPCDNPKFGDFQCNNAMQIFQRIKQLKTPPPEAPKNPRAVAEALLGSVPQNDVIQETSIAGPGFINIKVSKPWLADKITKMIKSDKGAAGWAPAPPYNAKKVLVDFSSPNVAKEMHVGHLRSTIIGDAICRALEFCGAEVLRINHIGDWGTQFGMLIQHMAETREGGLASVNPDDAVGDLMALYKEAKARFDAEEDFKTRAREAVTKLQSYQDDHVRAWKSICEASRREFQKIYDRLDVKLSERGESYYNGMLNAVVDELQGMGVAEESEGALVVKVDGESIPLMLRKSDGGYGYDSTDIAAVKQRIEQESCDWIVYVTDSGQEQHFRLVFGAARKCGYLQPHHRVDHVGFGLVLGEDGKKFKTRSGDVVRLVELLDEAVTRCEKVIMDRKKENGESEESVDMDQVRVAASMIGYGAVKYADLKNNRRGDYKFSFDQMLDLKGNTAVYLLYAYARIIQIFGKVGKDIEEVIKSDAVIQLNEPDEISLGLHLAKFPDAVEDMMIELQPSRVCEYLYALSDVFSGFYTNCKVAGSEYENSRLLLCGATAEVMRACFTILGIKWLNRI
eukprot:TRINITY_DN1944_c0_g1_i1.p1 TRINITY_DN1944_c0_g1~~TRINITY_DN1944_c0_g1_i1.p1  ORF type:complete len:627 (-),score=96.29 TRINITY_DN1944_c0_g1_i1:791-2671(-)